MLQELKEEHTRVLTAVNPHAPQNIVRFNFKVSQGRFNVTELLYAVFHIVKGDSAVNRHNLTSKSVSVI